MIDAHLDHDGEVKEQVDGGEKGRCHVIMREDNSRREGTFFTTSNLSTDVKK
jgi:hypothetical protein